MRRVISQDVDCRCVRTDKQKQETVAVLRMEILVGGRNPTRTGAEVSRADHPFAEPTKASIRARAGTTAGTNSNLCDVPLCIWFSVTVQSRCVSSALELELAKSNSLGTL